MAEIENLKIGSGGTIHIVGNEDIVAEAWAAGQNYVKDKSYVINNHVLYVCNTSHTSVSPFDPTNWTQITVTESLTSLVDAINEVIATSKLNPVYGNTASGAIATFDTSLALPLQDCTIDINAMQEGSGTPSPSNPRAISGFDSGVITRCGKNFLEPTLVSSRSVDGITFTALSDGTIRANGTATDNAILIINSIQNRGNLLDNLLPLNNVACIGSGCPNVPGCRIAFARMDGSSFADDTGSGRSFIISNLTPSTNAYVRVQVDRGYTVNNVIFKPMIRPASIVDDTYEAYNSNTYTVDFGQTVYGGSLDVTSGVLTVTHGFKTLTGGANENWKSHSLNANCFYIDNALDNPYLDNEKLDYAITNMFVQYAYNRITSLTNGQFCLGDTSGIQRLAFKNTGVETLADWKTWLSSNNLTIAYKLATPITVQLTPTQISAIVGTNNVFTDTNGDTSVVYACSLKDYIDSQ